MTEAGEELVALARVVAAALDDATLPTGWRHPV